MNTAIESTCPGCEKTFERKRLNQKFCTAQCKTRYHNHRAREERLRAKQRSGITASINSILWENRQIIAGMQGRIKVETLERRGFKMGYITQLERLSDGSTCFYCYDQRYVFVDESTVNLL